MSIARLEDEPVGPLLGIGSRRNRVRRPAAFNRRPVAGPFIHSGDGNSGPPLRPREWIGARSCGATSPGLTVGIQKTVEPVLGAIAGLLYFLMIPYYQSHLNSVWDLAAGASPATEGAAAPLSPPPPA